MRLQGKTAIVTGGAQGFGYAIAETFAKEGARVAIVDIQGDKAKDAAQAIGHGSIAITCDVTKAASVDACVRDAHEAFGRLDIIVNNAGITFRNKPLMETTEADYDLVFDVNVRSIFLFTRAVVPIMKAQGGPGTTGGVICNIGSTAGVRPRPGLTWYNASKGAVNLVSKSLAVELAPDRIRVNCIAPVAGETPLLSSFMGEDTPERRAQFTGTIPWGRFSLPQDVANAALYLCGDEAEMVTGAVLTVDGGRCI